MTEDSKHLVEIRARNHDADEVEALEVVAAALAAADVVVDLAAAETAVVAEAIEAMF